MNNLSLLQTSIKGKCPKCKEGQIFEGLFSLTLKKECAICGLDLAKNDSADGPAVFLIFILGFLLVPLALWLDTVFNIPLWVHAILWTIITLGLTLGSLKPLKSYIIALQFQHRPRDWES